MLNFLYFFKSFFKKYTNDLKILHFSHLVVVAHGGKDIAVGCHRWRHGVAQQPPWATAAACGIPSWATVVSFFLINERKHTIAMAYTMLILGDKMS
jgi:hypothetical protein